MRSLSTASGAAGKCIGDQVEQFGARMGEVLNQVARSIMAFDARG